MEKENITPLCNRRGKLIMGREELLNASEEMLVAIFSNFFPVAIEAGHAHKYYDSIVYYGMSPHFDVVEPPTILPEYVMELMLDETGAVKFGKMILKQ